MSPTPHPDQTLQLLKDSKGKRAHRNFDVLHEVCREIFGQKGPKDFSPSHVGALTEHRGGPAKNTLLAVQGRHFRTLIDAWAAFAGVDATKPSIAEPKEDDVLARIADPILRSYIRPIIQANRRLKAENNTLRALSNVTIDRRPQLGAAAVKETPSDLLTAAGPKLLDIERQALAVIGDERKLASLGLKVGAHGEVTATRHIPTGTDVLPVGFADGLAKSLATATTPRSITG
jgi:hypothetical protein